MNLVGPDGSLDAYAKMRCLVLHYGLVMVLFHTKCAIVFPHLALGTCFRFVCACDTQVLFLAKLKTFEEPTLSNHVEIPAGPFWDSRGRQFSGAFRAIVGNRRGLITDEVWVACFRNLWSQQGEVN